ncbi:MAG: hypothetical protein WCP31_07505, partial [Chloroflexales bacterium]
MIDVYKTGNMQTVHLQARRSQRSWWVMYLALIGVSVASSVLMLRAQPSPALLVWMLYLAGVVTTFYNPRYG